jgi:hypothetical protein
MNDDTRFILRSVGCIPAVLGAVTLALGAALAATGWRYMGLALVYALIYGAAATGVGLAVLATGRRWIALAAILPCAVSAAVTALYDEGGYTPPSAPILETWQIAVLAIDAIAILAALLQIFLPRRATQ